MSPYQTLDQTISLLRPMLHAGSDRTAFDHGAVLDAIRTCEPSSRLEAIAYVRDNRAKPSRVLLLPKTLEDEPRLWFFLEGQYQYKGAVRVGDKTVPFEIEEIEGAGEGSAIHSAFEKFDLVVQELDVSELDAFETELGECITRAFSEVESAWDQVREKGKEALMGSWTAEEQDRASAKHWNGDQYRWTSQEQQYDEARDDFARLIDVKHLERVKLNLDVGASATFFFGFHDLLIYTDYFRFTWDGRFISGEHKLEGMPTLQVWMRDGKVGFCEAEAYAFLDFITVPDYRDVKVY